MPSLALFSAVLVGLSQAPTPQAPGAVYDNEEFIRGAPPQVQQFISGLADSCALAGGEPKFVADFAHSAEINRDGMTDYLLHGAGLDCYYPGERAQYGREMPDLFCSSDLCSVWLFLSAPDGGARFAWGGLVGHAIPIEEDKLVISSGDCEAGECEYTIVWNGSRLVRGPQYQPTDN